jgi:hypothetical protein
MAGFWDFVTGNEAAMQQTNPTYGVPQQFVRDSAINALGQIGGLLMAAGQPVEPAIRAQLLGQIGGVGSGMTTDIFKAAQSRLMASQLQAAQEEQGRIQGLNQRLRDPEFVKRLGLTPDQAAILGPKGIANILETRATQKPTVTEYDRKLAGLIASGVDAPMAQGIASGRYKVVSDPVSGVSSVIDVATGRPVGAAPAAATGAPAPAAASAAETAAPSPTSAIPSDVDLSQATGLFAPARRAINAVTGLTTGESQFPETSKASNALADLRRRTILSFATEVPGRPTNYTQQLMEEATVDPYALFQSDPSALSRLQQTRSSISAEIERIETDILGKGGQAPRMAVKPEEVSKSRVNLSQLQRLREEYDQVIKQFGPKNKPSRADLEAEARRRGLRN